MKHPIQKIVKDEHGVLRFVENKIVSHILDKGPLTMNDLYMFDADDQSQFAQLIGYSLSGFGELSYVSDDVYYVAEKMAEGEDEKDAKIKYLQEKLNEVRETLKTLTPKLFRIHADDLIYQNLLDMEKQDERF